MDDPIKDRLTQDRMARQEAIADYAMVMAGSGLDLDVPLEQAGIEHLFEAD
jgi:hypothetical protein